MKKQRGRPAKPREQRKNVDLRIPVTATQKAIVMEAVEMDGTDMASWARPILLQAAQERIQAGARSK